MSQLNHSLLQDESFNSIIDATENASKLDFVLAQFEVSNGPQIIHTTLQNVPNGLADELFPAKWENGETFVFKTKDYFFYAKCVLTNIPTSRGILQLTIALASPTFSFTPKCLHFFDNITEVAQSLNQLNLDPLITAFSSEFNGSTDEHIHHPIQNFTQNSSVCNFFKKNPLSLLTLWRARLCGLSIVFAGSSSVFTATNISYFLSICNIIPGRSRNLCQDCAFHIDISANSKANERNWKICFVTHPILQESIKADVVIKEDASLSVIPQAQWILKGRGEIVKKITNFINMNNDAALVHYLIEENTTLYTLISREGLIQSSTIRNIDLDKANYQFVQQFGLANGINVEFNTGCCA